MKHTEGMFGGEGNMTGSAIKAVEELGIGALKNNLMKTGKNIDGHRLGLDGKAQMKVGGKTLDLANPLPKENIRRARLFWKWLMVD